MGNTATNNQIQETLKKEEERKIFWKLNNGVTATCAKITEETNVRFRFDDFKIVNGRQTTYALVNNKQYVDDTVELQLIVHESTDADERLSISKTTNTQNPIKAQDLVVADKSMKLLEFDVNENHTGWYFENQRGGFRNLGSNKKKKKRLVRKRCMEKEPTMRKFCAYRGEPCRAIKESETDLFHTDNLEKIFKGSATLDFIFPHIFFHLLNELAKSWKKDQEVKGYVLALRIVKFYILGLIHSSIEDMEETEKKRVLEEIYSIFSDDEKTDKHEELLGFIESSYDFFIVLYNQAYDKNEGIELGDKSVLEDSTRLRRYLISNEELFDTILRRRKDMKRAFGDPMHKKLLDLLHSTK